MAGPDVRALQSRTELLKPDILIVYPARFTTGKQFEKVAALGGVIAKKTERQVRIVFCDFPCLDTDAAAYKRIIRATGEVCGLAEPDMACDYTVAEVEEIVPVGTISPDRVGTAAPFVQAVVKGLSLAEHEK